jgi:predicted 2-oxoglutarate/Fe(II)-dependent dioxygenase YbiX
MPDAWQTLEQLLRSLGESSQFVTSGSVPLVLPELEVKAVGPIGSPTSPADAKRLIAKATQAPYGRGEETIVDKKVRRVWQIEPSKLAFRNAEWNAHITKIIDAIKEEFSIDENVSAELYKLLIYEKGSFFAPHRDSEKSPGMFATLVVCLPSRHEGGTFIVKHDSQTKEIDFGGAGSEFKTQFAAFYADCQHEITPVTAGFRICVVYNLAITGKKQQPTAPNNAPAVEQAAALLKEIFDDTSTDRSKIAIPFSHEYSEAGLEPNQLKGADRTRAEVLVRAAESLEYQCYFALLTHEQSGEVDYDSWSVRQYNSRRSYRWSHHDDEHTDPDEVEMGEVYEEERSLDHWVDPEGHKQPFGRMHFEENELLCPEGRDHWSIKQEIREATGNEGVSMDRWYRQGVIVIWPRERYFGILAAEGQVSAVPALEQMAAQSKSDTLLAACRTFAEEIIGRWQPRQRVAGIHEFQGSRRMLELLETIGTPKLFERFLTEVLPKDFDGSEGKALYKLLQRFDWKPYGAALRDFLAQQKPENYYTRVGQVLSICVPLCCDPPALTAERRAVCTSLAGPLAEVIDRWDNKQSYTLDEDEFDDEDHHDRFGEKRAGVVESIVRIFGTISDTERLDHFLDHVLAKKQRYKLRKVLIPDIKEIYKWAPEVPAARPAASRLLQHCLTELRTATARPIEGPKDWTRDAQIACTCEDCRMLSRFLSDPAKQEGRFPLRKDRRQHLHQQIEKHHLDLTHVTFRAGSPQTLVCTKTLASYERRRKQYEVDKKLLTELESLADDDKKPSVKSPSRRRSPKK